MLDLSSVRALSAVALVILVVRLYLSGRYARPRKGEDLGMVKASTPAPVLNTLCPFLMFLPLIFCILGVITPGLVYGTPLNLSFNGAEYLQYASLSLIAVGAFIAAWSSKALGQQAAVAAEIRENPQLVTSGPYTYVRHPGYTARILIDFGVFLLLFNALQLTGCLTWIVVAYKKAAIEEELLSSENGFGKEYRDYMSMTGRFLPKLR